MQVCEGDQLTVFLEDFMVPPWESLDLLERGDLLRVTLSSMHPPDIQTRRLLLLRYLCIWSLSFCPPSQNFVDLVICRDINY